MSENMFKKTFRYINEMGISRFISDEKEPQKQYYKVFKKYPDLDNPKTFNEKLQWLKLNDRKEIYTTMVDKYEAKKYVSSIIGEEYIVPTLGVWDKFSDIDFDKLPNQFVLKCTHDSGGIMICKDKNNFNIKKARLKFNLIMKRNFFYRNREWPYKNVKPRIIAEKLLEDGKKDELSDYKLMCFNGKVKCSFVCTNRKSKTGVNVNFYDTKWNPMPFTRHYPKNSKEILKPSKYDKMVELAEILSKEIPFVRVDFYQVKDKLYFGELTFYPGGGLEEFTPEEWDYKLGELIKLPEKQHNDKC